MPLAGLGTRMPKAGMLWLALCMLLALGLASSLLSGASETQAERARATYAGQHMEFDGQTGERLSYRPTDKAREATKKPAAPAKPKTPQFDVAPAAPKPAEHANATKPKSDAQQPNRPPIIPAGEEEAAAAGEALISRVPPKLGVLPGRTSESLVNAPAPEVSQKTTYGEVPKIAKNGGFAGKLYARQYALSDGSVPLSIVVSGLGFSRDALSIALSLPNDIALAFSPYAPELEDQIKLARVSGHEVWAELPSQNPDYPATDPGPLGQIASLSDADANKRMLQWMAKTHGIVGGIFAPDETLSQFGSAMKRPLDMLAEHGLMALFTEPARARFLPAMPRELLAKVADARIDGTSPRAIINSQLNGLLDATQHEGNYILVAEATPHLLKLLKQWSEQLPEVSPVKLAPLSAVYLDAKAKAAKQAAEKAAAAAEAAGEHKKEESTGGGH